MHCDFSHSFVWLRCRHSSLCELFIACGSGFPKVSTFLYGTADPEKLTAEQKDTVANIMSLAGAGVGAAVGNTSANAVSGSLNAESAVENNDSADYHGNFAGDRASISHAKSIYPNNSKNVELFLKGKNEGEALGAKQGFEDILNGILSLPQTILDNGKTFANSNGIIPLYLYIQVKQANDTVKAIQIELKTWQAAYEYAKIHDPYLAGQMYGMMSGRIAVNTTSLVLPTGAITQSGKLTKLGSLLDKQKLSNDVSNLGIHNTKYNESLHQKITNKGNTLHVEHLSTTSMKEFDLIRDFLKQDKINSITNKKNSLIKGKLEDLESISIATATVYDKTGKPTNYLAISGKSWSGQAPNKITINDKTYSVIRIDNERLPNHNRKTNDGTSVQTNFNHAEKKLMGFITEQNQKYSNINRVEMKIQNTNPEYPGACMACGGTNGYQGSIGDFQKRNMNLKIHIEHGSTKP